MHSAEQELHQMCGVLRDRASRRACQQNGQEKRLTKPEKLGSDVTSVNLEENPFVRPNRCIVRTLVASAATASRAESGAI
eukprot:2074714-Rhodomonas_salina.2